MANEAQLIEALRRADAAGNTQDAQALANAIKEMRSGASQAQPAIQSTDDLFNALGAEDGLSGQMQEAPQRGNPVSRAIGDFADQRVAPGIGGHVVSGVARAGQGIAEDPLKTLVVDPLTSLGRSGGHLRAIGPNLLEGNFAEAGKNTIDAATLIGEAGLLVAAPGAGSVVRQGATSAARGAGAQLLDDAARAGVDATVPMAFPRTGGAVSKQLAENIPAGVTTRAGADKTLKQLEGSLTRQADEFAPSSTLSDAGSTAREGATRFNSRSQITPDESATIRQPARFSTFRDKAEAIYSKAYRGFDAKSTASVPNTLSQLENVNARFSDEALGELFQLPTAKKLENVLSKGKDGAIKNRADDLLVRALEVKKQAPAHGGSSLADFVRKSGGVRDPGKDALNAIGNTVKGRPGLVNNTNGRQIDDLIIDAVEEGYFPGANLDQGIVPSQREFLDALTDDVQGRRVFRPDDAAARSENAAFDRLHDELQQMGVDVRAPRAQLMKRVEEATGEKLSGAELSIADMRALRTEIREIQNSSKILKTRDDAALERLEGALTQDIYTAVEAAGGKRAVGDLKRADKYYRLGSERIRKSLEPFVKDKATDETASQAILRAASGQGKGDIQRLRALRRSLRPDEMDDISSGVLREIGRAKEGADFSPEAFARKWQTMGDDAKAVLFDRAQRPEARQNLDALARLIERQSNVEGLSNRSRSGANAQNFGTAIAFIAEPVTATSAVVGANVMGRLLMSPSFTKALLQMQRSVPSAARAGASEAKARAKILSLISVAEQSDAAIKPYTAEIRAALKASNDNQGPSQSSQVRQRPPE